MNKQKFDINELVTKRQWEAAGVECYDTRGKRGFDRREYNKKIGWCIHTKETVAILANYLEKKKTIEVFSGTGFLAKELRNRKQGLDYKAYDNFSMVRNYRKNNLGSIKKNAFAVNIKDADVIVMVWPEYDVRHASRIARKMKVGQVLIFQGELGGCTATEEFYDYVRCHFNDIDQNIEKLLNDHGVSFEYMRDRWHILVKSSEQDIRSTPYKRKTKVVY